MEFSVISGAMRTTTSNCWYFLNIIWQLNRPNLYKFGGTFSKKIKLWMGEDTTNSWFPKQSIPSEKTINNHHFSGLGGSLMHHWMVAASEFKCNFPWFINDYSACSCLVKVEAFVWKIELPQKVIPSRAFRWTVELGSNKFVINPIMFLAPRACEIECAQHNREVYQASGQ